MAADPKGELVDFLVHQAFYPVLMAERRGPNKARIEQVQDATRAAIDRFRSYGSAEEVIDNFMRELRSYPHRNIETELKRLRLPVIGDLHEKFERKARELGFEPDTLLTSPLPPSNPESTSMDQHEGSRPRVHAVWERTGRPDGAQDQHWLQARRGIEAEHSTTAADPIFAADPAAGDGALQQTSLAAKS